VDLTEAFVEEELFVQVPLWVYPQAKVKMSYHHVEGYELHFAIVSWHRWQPWLIFLESFRF